MSTPEGPSGHGMRELECRSSQSSEDSGRELGDGAGVGVGVSCFGAPVEFFHFPFQG